MEQLKIGDELYFKRYARFSDNFTIQFATVERLTKTQVILTNGVRLKNNPIRDFHGKYGFRVHGGNTFDTWHIKTEEVVVEAKIEKEKQIICSWFERRKFTNEEKKIIYLKFKELNLLENK